MMGINYLLKVTSCLFLVSMNIISLKIVEMVLLFKCLKFLLRIMGKKVFIHYLTILLIPT